MTAIMSDPPSARLARFAGAALPGAFGWLAAAMLVAVGVSYLSGPQRSSSAMFGLPAVTRAERAFLATKAVRDLGLGLVTAILLARRDPKAAGAALAVGVAGPALDGALLTAIRGPRAQLGVHWGAAALMGAAARGLLR